MVEWMVIFYAIFWGIKVIFHRTFKAIREKQRTAHSPDAYLKEANWLKSKWMNCLRDRNEHTHSTRNTLLQHSIFAAQSRIQKILWGSSSFCGGGKSANSHICKEKGFLVGEIYPVNQNSGVDTISGTDFGPSLIGKVEWTWHDNNGQKHTLTLENVLYLPDSPVNILSVTMWADAINYYKGIWILTKRNHSVFAWDQGNLTRLFQNSTSRLPELLIGGSFGWFAHFLSFFLATFQSDELKKWHC